MATSDQGVNWQMYLDPSFYDVPLHALRNTVCHRLSLYLDIEDVVIHNGILPNYSGLAELIGFTGLEIMAFERDKTKSTTQALLAEWKSRHDLKPIVGRLVEFLCQLGRIDALTDCHQAISSEAKIFMEKDSKALTKPIQDETVSQGPGTDVTPDYITRHDVLTGKKTYYDAYICYNPAGESSKDLEFVKQLIERFEDKHHFTLFVPFRDDLPGMNEHTINAKIISERCRHMIVVLSKNFLQSEACEFQTTFAQSLSPGARNKRIVPIKIEDCVIPNILRIMACCDFTKRDLWDWSWERLAKSISTHLTPDEYPANQALSETASNSSRTYGNNSPSILWSSSSISSSPDSGVGLSQTPTPTASSSASHSSSSGLRRFTEKLGKSKPKNKTKLTTAQF